MRIGDDSMKFVGILIVFLLASNLAWAQAGYEIEKTNTAKTRVIVKGVMKNVSEGLVLEFTDEFQEPCRGEVIQVNEDSAVVDVSSCANKKAIKAGVFMAPSQAKPESYLGDRSEPAKPSRMDSSSLASANESWYTLWGLGLSRATYEDPIDGILDDLEDADGVDRITINLDFLGFYWPDPNYKTMYGVIINAVNDQFTDSIGDTFSILQYTIGFSVHHFFGTNIGDGWFVRGDIGPAFYVIDLDTNSGDFRDDSDFGYGLLAGGGYALPIGSETRMLFGSYLAYRSADSDDITTLNFSVSFLF